MVPSGGNTRTSVLHYFAAKGDVVSVADWLRRNSGINPDTVDLEGRTPLWFACCFGHFAVVEILLSAGANPNFKVGNSRHTPMHAACYHGHHTLLRQLVEAGGDLSPQSIMGLTPLHSAVTDGCCAGVREIVRLGADVNIQDIDGVTALMACANSYTNKTVHNSAEKAKILLDVGASVDVVDREGATALHIAAKAGNLPVVQTLLNAGVELSGRTKEGMTALMWASYSGHVEVVRLLCAAGADSSCELADGSTCLSFAVTRDHAEVVRELVGAGVDVNHGRADAQPLISACERKNPEIVRQLLDAGADPSVSESGPDSRTALSVAIDLKQVEIVRDLVRAGADVDATVNNCPPLITVAMCGNAEIARILVEASANIMSTATIVSYTCGPRGRMNEFTLEDKSALHYAVSCGHVSVTRVLLRAGCLESATDSRGCLPACLVGKNLMGSKDPCKEEWMRRVLARGPAFRALSWGWPTEPATNIAADRGVTKCVKRGEVKKVLVNLKAFRHRRNERRPGAFITTIYRHVRGNRFSLTRLDGSRMR